MISALADIRNLLRDLPPPDADAAAGAAARNDRLTKPPGSLGRLEELAVWMASWQGRHPPRASNVTCMVFAGNHGVIQQHVSAFPADVTEQMVANFAAGGAGINQLARSLDARLNVVPLSLERPTGDISREPAMTEAETCDAFRTGFETVQEADMALIGDMGIGNTTVAAALGAALFGGDGADWAGPGTGLDRQGVDRKAAVIDQALERHRRLSADPLETLASLGGREIAAMAGAILACRLKRTPVILDGFVNCAAASVLHCLEARALDHCMAGHVSAEPAAGRFLDHLGKRPLLDLGMRLGEGSGAACAALIVRAAVALHAGMATFDEAGVSGKRDDP